MESKSKLCSTTNTSIKMSIKKYHTDRCRRRILQNFLLIWVGTNITLSDNDFQHALEELRSMAYDVYIFNEVDECVDFLTDIDIQHVSLITSGEIGQKLVPTIHSMPYLDGIYFLCDDEDQYVQWAKEWHKIKGVYTKFKPIHEALQLVVKQSNQDSIPVSFLQLWEGESNTNLNQLESSFMYTKLFKSILLDIEHTENSIQDLVTYWRRIYNDNQAICKVIDDFQKNYRAKSPIWWYTRQVFTYQMINHALRLLEADNIVNVGFLISDIHRQIEQLHNEQLSQFHEQSFIVYRGQGLSVTDFEKLKKNKGGLMSFNSFLSTSKERSVALLFADSVTSNTNMVGILFTMTIDSKITSMPFSNIDNLSNFEQEVEVLFSMHTVFRIDHINCIDNDGRIYEVQLTLTEDDDKQLRDLTAHFDKEVAAPTGWQRLVNLLIRVRELYKAEELCNKLLQQSSDYTNEALCYHHLGLIKYLRSDYQEAVLYYEKAIDIENKTLPANHYLLGTSYNNIALVYYEMGEYLEAISFYDKALHIREETLLENHPLLACSYNNIGLVNFAIGEFSKALSFYEKAFHIQHQNLPGNHPDIATTYGNIGVIYNYMSDYSKALEFYEKAHQIYEKVLPSNHPYLAISY